MQKYAKICKKNKLTIESMHYETSIFIIKIILVGLLKNIHLHINPDSNDNHNYIIIYGR